METESAEGGSNATQEALPLFHGDDQDSEEMQLPTDDGLPRRYERLRTWSVGLDDLPENQGDDEEERSMKQDDNMNLEEESWLMYRILNTTFLPDSPITVRGAPLVEDWGVKMFKFLAFTIVGLVLYHQLVRWVGWENDEDYSLMNMLMVDANLIALDVVVFFCVGRLYRQRGVDHLAWVIWATISCIFTSWSKRFWFLHYALTLYQIRCTWPWQLWLFIFLMAPPVIYIILYHFRYAYKQGVLLKKLFEIATTFLLFLIPYMPHPAFHLHHYYAFWLFGMHANFDVWWSRAAMAWSWGQYINGIAVFGRDPLLTCFIAFYQSTNQQCSFMECYSVANISNATLEEHEYKPMVEPDWRNCSADLASY